jgi:hypothetical protein
MTWALRSGKISILGHLGFLLFLHLFSGVDFSNYTIANLWEKASFHTE